MALPFSAAAEVEAPRGLEVLLHAVALFVKAAEAELRGREPGFGGAFEPARGFFEALRNAAAFEMAHRDLVFGGRIAARRRIAQRGRQFVRRDQARIGRGAGIGSSVAGGSGCGARSRR